MDLTPASEYTQDSFFIEKLFTKQNCPQERRRIRKDNTTRGLASRKQVDDPISNWLLVLGGSCRRLAEHTHRLISENSFLVLRVEVDPKELVSSKRFFRRPLHTADK